MKSGEVPQKVLPAEAVYYFPGFVTGEATLRAGGKATQKFNYNYLLDEMQFLTVTGDTMAIAEPHLVMVIKIDSVSYYFDKGYLRELCQSNGYTLALRERLVQGDFKKESAYGTTSGTSSINSMEGISVGNNQIVTLEARREIFFIKRNAVFIGDRYNRFVRANKKGFASVFPEKKKAMEAFIGEQKINFNNLEDLQKLLAFCSQ
ncbi:MAG: hypothetical protein KF679_11530 [Chitinophagaceae bacterium]|nr:hypothetical protein [Chitinophagaceae bacterium]